MYKHFQNLINTKGEVSDKRQINFIAEYAFKIAVGYLKLSYVRVQRLIGGYDMSYEDIAIDSIAPLFVKNKDDMHYVLVGSYINWKPKIRDNDDALFFLNKVVAARVEQHITLLFREADPVFGKILDSVNYLIEKKKFKKVDYLGHLYIVEKNCAGIDGVAIDPIDFECLPLSLFYNNKQTAIKNILKYIRTHSDYFPAIPLNSFVGKLKHLSFLDENNGNEKDYFFNRIEIEECVDRALEATLKKLRRTYLASKKISSRECKLFEKVLNDIAYDLKCSGMQRRIYFYFVNQLPFLTNKEFKTKYKNIIEYLYKQMRKSIAAGLKN